MDSRTFTVTADHFTQLRDLQEITVNWSGAHPTGGVVGDQNSLYAAQEEYPVVLLECRGVDSPTAPAAQQLEPQTCWTQTPPERYQADNNVASPPWRLDRYASPANRQASVGAPDPRPAACPMPVKAEYFVPFVAADGKSYGGGPFGCAGLAPEQSNLDNALFPSNTTYGVSGLDGSGSAKFVAWNSETNASLNCSEAVACSLVVVPIMGVSCDETAPIDASAVAACTATGAFGPGQIDVQPTSNEDLAVSGALWWAASNWRNRVTIPLTFAPPGNICSLIGTHVPVQIYGSELMEQATTQWAPKFCLDPTSFAFTHVATGEPEAASLLSAGTVEAAFVSETPPGGYPGPVVTAPVGLTGFGIAVDVDGTSGRDYPNVRLDARLLAKLLAESYPADIFIKDEYPALAHNPLDMSLDPEFVALNPGIPIGVFQNEAAATLLSLSSDSDVVYALTSYINADPEARAWLNGAPDPWGMTVNPNYKGISLPTTSWPLLDTFEPTTFYQTDNNNCLHDEPVPYLPLVAAPVTSLTIIAQHMQFTLANSQTVCTQPGGQGVRGGEKLTGLGRQTPGYRFLLGVVSLAAAQEFGIETAQLETQTSPAAPTRFTDSSGRSFAGPSDASVLAAAKLLTPDSSRGTWTVPYARLRSDPSAASAYPGTMLVSMSVPTTGLPAIDAAAYAKLIDFAAGPGQIPGVGVGQLPPGYQPITTAAGLGNLVAYDKVAAAAVLGQHGLLPPLIAAVTAPTAHLPNRSRVAQPAPLAVSLPVTSLALPAAVPATRVASPRVRTEKGHVALALPPVSPEPVAASTPVGPVGPLGELLPLLLALAVVAGTGAMAVHRLARRRAGR